MRVCDLVRWRGACETRAYNASTDTDAYGYVKLPADDLAVVGLFSPLCGLDR